MRLFVGAICASGLLDWMLWGQPLLTVYGVATLAIVAGARGTLQKRRRSELMVLCIAWVVALSLVLVTKQRRIRRARASIEMLTNAIRSHMLTHGGSPPENLNALVPRYISALPSEGLCGDVRTLNYSRIPEPPRVCVRWSAVLTDQPSIECIDIPNSEGHSVQ
jgi:hypothetical protein